MTYKTPKLTFERLQETLHYDPDTGNFTRIATGAPAGGMHHTGYLYIRIDGKRYAASRLAWMYMTGNFPEKFIDHKNRRPADNRWDNLREASPSENRANTAANRNNKTGVKGVYLHRGRYDASVRVRGKLIHVGCFATVEEARIAWEHAAKKYHGEFFRSS